MVEKVYLLRHGHIDTGGEKRYVGQTDIPLDTLGLEQAQELREYFKAIPIDSVFTSPLRRCVQTTQIIFDEYQCIEKFREIDMGEWENIPIAYIKSHYPKLYAQRGNDLEYFRPPNGENFHDVAERVRYAFDTIVHHAKGTIVIIAHAGVNRMILSRILGIEINAMLSIEQPYACVNELKLDSQSMQWEYKRVL